MAARFPGASGLFAMMLKPVPKQARIAALLNGMELFGMGYSWGGYESLILPTNRRSCAPPPPGTAKGR